LKVEPCESKTARLPVHAKTEVYMK